jgi:hypothetical protein
VHSINTNGIYCAVVFDDGSVTMNDVQNDFLKLADIEKPIKRDAVAINEETKKCLKVILLPDRNSMLNPMTG